MKEISERILNQEVFKRNILMLFLKRLLLINKIKCYGITLNESAEIISLLEANLRTCKQISKSW